MSIAPEARPFILLALAAVLVFWIWGGSVWAAVPLAALAFIVYFFRDPSRPQPSGEGLILSPADGRVVEIRQVEDDRFPGGRARRVSIFLSLFDVHVNRAPATGRVAGVAYTPGRFQAAFRSKASEGNERNRIDLESEGGPLAVTQIAGAIARRIVCDVRPGDPVRAGDRLGLIRFGSRVDLLLPLDALLKVQEGDRVRTTSTILAQRAAAGGAGHAA